MIKALCSRNESVSKVAGDELARHGPAVMLQLIRGAPSRRCRVENVMPTIMCAGPIIEDGDKGQHLWEEALAALLAMNGSADHNTAFTGMSVLSSMAFRYSRQNCPAGGVVFARRPRWRRSCVATRMGSAPSIVESVSG